MDLLEQSDETRFLGRDFLTWLWFRSETDGVFESDALGRFHVVLADRIELSADSADDPETVIVRGTGHEIFEARIALSRGKAVSRAVFRLSNEGDEWVMTLDDTWLSPRSLKIPKVLPPEEEPDREGMLLERVYLIERSIAMLDALAKTFITLRTSAEWEKKTLPAVRDWIKTAIG